MRTLILAVLVACSPSLASAKTEPDGVFGEWIGVHSQDDVTDKVGFSVFVRRVDRIATIIVACTPEHIDLESTLFAQITGPIGLRDMMIRIDGEPARKIAGKYEYGPGNNGSRRIMVLAEQDLGKATGHDELPDLLAHAKKLILRSGLGDADERDFTFSVEGADTAFAHLHERCGNSVSGR